eukprot:Tbor_TRINITY_DN5680_c0_g1::TRINITY_DN5680_c0_g1_i12::g.9031::m.9031
MLGGKQSGVINEASNLVANQNLTKAAEFMQSTEYRRTRDIEDVIPTAKHLLVQKKEVSLDDGLKTYDPVEEKAIERDARQEDDDAELDFLRERRRAFLKMQQEKHGEWLSKQHGSYREIEESSFFSTVVREKGGSDDVALHFFHKDFERCKIMDRHLQELAPQMMSIKFAKIDADKSPFLVERLRVNMLPCVVLFHNDVAVDRIVGFDGLGEDDIDQSALRERILVGLKLGDPDNQA